MSRRSRSSCSNTTGSVTTTTVTSRWRRVKVDRPRDRHAHTEIAAHEQRARQTEQRERDEAGKLPEHGPDRNDDGDRDVENDQTPCGQSPPHDPERHPIVVAELRHHEAVHEPRTHRAPGREQRRRREHQHADDRAGAAGFEQALGLGRPEGVEQRERREHHRRDPRDRERMRSIHTERRTHHVARNVPPMVHAHASKSVAVRGLPPGPLYAMPYIGSWSNAIVGRLAARRVPRVDEPVFRLVVERVRQHPFLFAPGSSGCADQPACGTRQRLARARGRGNRDRCGVA